MPGNLPKGESWELKAHLAHPRSVLSGAPGWAQLRPPQCWLHPYPRNPGYELTWKRALKLADGIKAASQLSVKQEGCADHLSGTDVHRGP